jgi:hypothetical protein
MSGWTCRSTCMRRCIWLRQGWAASRLFGLRRVLEATERVDSCEACVPHAQADLRRRAASASLSPCPVTRLAERRPVLGEIGLPDGRSGPRLPTTAPEGRRTTRLRRGPPATASRACGYRRERVREHRQGDSHGTTSTAHAGQASPPGDLPACTGRVAGPRGVEALCEQHSRIGGRDVQPQSPSRGSPGCVRTPSSPSTGSGMARRGIGDGHAGKPLLNIGRIALLPGGCGDASSWRSLHPVPPVSELCPQLLSCGVLRLLWSPSSFRMSGQGAARGTRRLPPIHRAGVVPQAHLRSRNAEGVPGASVRQSNYIDGLRLGLHGSSSRFGDTQPGPVGAWAIWVEGPSRQRAVHGHRLLMTRARSSTPPRAGTPPRRAEQLPRRLRRSPVRR